MGKERINSYLGLGELEKRGLIHDHRFMGHSCRALAKAYVGSPTMLIELTEKHKFCLPFLGLGVRKERINS